MDAFQDKEVGKGREGEICGFHEHLRFETIPWLCPKEVTDLSAASREQSPCCLGQSMRHGIFCTKTREALDK